MNTVSFARFYRAARRAGYLVALIALLAAALGRPTAAVLAAPGTGSFKLHPTTPHFGNFTVNAKPNDVQLGDIDNDGDLDALLIDGPMHEADGQTDAVHADSLWKNDGSGNFTWYRDLAYTDPESQLTTLGNSTNGIFIDIDNDGTPANPDLDIVIANFDSEGREEIIWRNDGAGNYSYLTRFNTNDRTRWAAADHLDGDNNWDIISVAGGSIPLVIYEYNAGVMDLVQSSDNNAYVDHVALSDVNHDGRKDFLFSLFAFSGADYGGIFLYMNDADWSDNFAPYASLPGGKINGSTDNHVVLMGDFNGDGDEDMLAGGPTGAQVYLYTGGSALFSAPVSISTHNIRRGDLGDIDGDGDIDAVLANTDSTEDEIFVNNGSGVFTPSPAAGLIAAGLETRAARLGDVDGDGDLDLLTTDTGSRTSGHASTGVSVWINYSGPTTTNITKGAVNEDTSVSFAALDFTGAYTPSLDDPQPMVSMRVTALPANSTLRLGSTPAAVNQVIPVGQLDSLTFRAAADFNGSTSFTWQAFDGTHWSNFSAANMTFNPVADTPVSQDITLAGEQEDTAVTFSAAVFNTGYYHGDGIPLDSIQLISLPAHGTLRLGTAAVTLYQVIPAAQLGSLTFTPAANWFGLTSFDWRAHAATSWTNTSTVNMTFAQVNDAPTARDVLWPAFNEDTQVTFTTAAFTAAYSDLESNPLASIRVTLLPAHGTLRLGSVPVALNAVIPAAQLGSLVFAPAANWHGSTSFAWQASDGELFSNLALVNLTVNSVVDVPVIVNINRPNEQEDVAATFTTAAFTGAYSHGDGTPLVSVRVASLPANGTLRLGSEPVLLNAMIPTAQLGSLVFVPAANWYGSTSFSWQAYDGTAYSTARAVNMTFSPINDAPVVSSIEVQHAGLSTLFSLDLSAFVSDADQPTGPFTYTLTSGPAGAAITGGVFTWTAPVNSAGSSVTVQFTVSDGAASGTGSFVIAVANSSHPPVLDAPVSGSYTATFPISVVVSGHDTHTDPLIFNVVSTSMPAGAHFDTTTNTFTWTPTRAQVGVHRIIFTIDDNHGVTEFERTFTITAPMQVFIPSVSRAP